MKTAWLLAGALASVHAGAQVLVKDLNPLSYNGHVSSGPQGFLATAGKVFFGARGELWSSDGTAAGTVLLRDPFPGPGGSAPRALTPFGNGFVFVAKDPVHGEELWISDGTTAGTRLVSDSVPGPDAGTIEWVEPAGALVYFEKTVPAGTTATCQLWRSDGTIAGTLPLQVSSNAFLGGIAGAALGTRFVFRAEGQPGRSALYVTDGTSAGTVSLLDLGKTVYGPEFNLCSVGGVVFFSATGDATGHELWRTDGTVSGTWPVADLAPGAGDSRPRWLTRFGNKVFFSAEAAANDREPWVSDGTAAGTVRLYDFTPLWTQTGQQLFPLAVVGTRLLFSANGVYTAGIWSTDGTPAGTSPVLYLLPALSTTARWPTPQLPVVTVLNGVAYLAAYDPGGTWGNELWASDGTPAGTRLVADLEPGSRGSNAGTSGMAVVGNRLLFAAGVGGQNELWSSDGTQSGTALLADLGSNGFPLGANARYFWAIDDTAFFEANDGSTTQYWRSDGTANGTVPAPPIAKEIGRGNTRVGDRLCFAARKDSGTATISSTGLDLGSSTPLLDVATTGDNFGVVAGTAAGTAWLTVSDYYQTNVRLIATDGTPSGTSLLLTRSYRLFVPLGSLGSTLLFMNCYSSPAGPGDYQLWKSDGTAPGTTQLQSNGTNGPLGEVSVLNGAGYFFWSDGTRFDLWRTDATAAGTKRVTDASFGEIQPWGGTSTLSWTGATPPAVVAGRVLFVSKLANGTSGLWASDGTSAGSKLVHTFASLQNPLFTECNGALLFAAYEPPLGRELWRTDGTAAGTTLVRDIVPADGSGLATAGEMLRVGGTRVLFAGFEPASGIEPWISDGTFLGTRRLADLAPGNASSSPTGFFRAGTNVFFTADDGSTGPELWRVTIAELGAVLVDPLGTGCLGTAGVPALRAAGLPILGNGAFALELAQALPSVPVVWLLGSGYRHVPLGGDCTLHVAGTLLGIGAASDGAGRARLPLAVPSLPGLLGLDLAAQAGIADPLGAWSRAVALSDAVRFVIGAP